MKVTDNEQIFMEYWNRGIVILPVPPGEKGPRIKNWPDFCCLPQNVPDFFPPGCNFGAILGARSNHLTDIDLDCIEAIRAAEVALPETSMISGRVSKPKSHYWYLCEGAETEKFVDPDTGEMLVEIRSTGCQTVVPPSVHPSGEVIEWC